MALVRGEMGDTDLNWGSLSYDGCSSFSEERSKRNRHQQPSLRGPRSMASLGANSLQSSRNHCADSVPLQKCVYAAQNDKKLKKHRGRSVCDPGCPRGHSHRKTKDSEYGESKKSRNTERAYTGESLCNDNEINMKLMEVKVEPEKYEVKGPPSGPSHSNRLGQSPDSDKNCKGKMVKKKKEEKNILKLEGKECDNKAAELQINKDQCEKYRQKIMEKMDLEKETEMETSCENNDVLRGRNLALLMEKARMASRDKQVVVDNRLVEESEDQTTSKQRLDPMFEEKNNLEKSLEDNDSKYLCKSLEENHLQQSNLISNQPTEHSWSSDADSHQTHSLRSMKSDLLPIRRVARQSFGRHSSAREPGFHSQEDGQLFGVDTRNSENQSNQLQWERDRNRTNNMTPEKITVALPIEAEKGDQFNNEEKVEKDLSEKEKAGSDTDDFPPDEEEKIEDGSECPDAEEKEKAEKGDTETAEKDNKKQDEDAEKVEKEDKDTEKVKKENVNAENLEKEDTEKVKQGDENAEKIEKEDGDTEKVEKAGSELEEEIAEKEDGVFCSLKVYDCLRLHEIKEMNVAFQKVTDLTKNLQKEVENLRQFLSESNKDCSPASQGPIQTPVPFFAKCKLRGLLSQMSRKGAFYGTKDSGDYRRIQQRLRKWRIFNQGNGNHGNDNQGNGFLGNGCHGRRCSSGGNGQTSGGSTGSSQSSTGSNKESSGSGNSSYGSSGGLGNHGNRDTGGGGDGQYPNQHGSKTPEDATVPPYNPKYRRKHEKMEANAWQYFLGILSEKTREGPVCEIDNETVLWCVSHCLANPDDLSDEMLSCNVCTSVNGFLKHYADCYAQYSACSMCVQIFSLICAHVTDCMNNNSCTESGSPCDIALCTNIMHTLDGSLIVNHTKMLWFHIRKKLARLIGSCDEVDQFNPDVAALSSRSSIRLSSITRPSLPIIPEGEVAPSAPLSNSRVLVRKRSNLANVEERTEPVIHQAEYSHQQSEVNVAEPVAADAVLYSRAETVEEEQSRSETQSEVHDLGEAPTSSGSGGSSQVSDPPSFGRHGPRIQSLPPGSKAGWGENYFPSLTDAPMGIKGIGEVQYGDRGRIVVVAEYWLGLKDKYNQRGSLAKHYREEGIILMEYKSRLKVQGIRYGCQFQWIKHNPLGNGMSGKCHLASDFETNFKFCVKEIHISNYEKEEIVLWSELNHPNIVKVYGAIRHRETIYILQEFVEGGNLTEAINIQKELNRRLSQVTALSCIWQLLQALVYLRSKNILHEDLKSDNILLQQDKGSVKIKVTDFGLARLCANRMGPGVKPVGTQTQWSPEKCEGVGYGYPAEVWALGCIAVHILSGSPPWIRRFEHSKTLMFLIVKQSPPLEDIPRNISDELRDFIERCFTVCQNTRPRAHQLLKHQVFQQLDNGGTGRANSILYSNLPSARATSVNTLPDDPNADLREIFRNLEKGKNKQVPEQPVEVTVYTLHGQEQGASAQPNANSAGSQLAANTSPETEAFEARYGADVTMGNLETRRSREWMHALPDIDQNTLYQYLNDSTSPTPPPPLSANMTLYDPEQYINDDESESVETPTDQTIMQQLLPDFELLGLQDLTIKDDDVEDEEEDDMFRNFDLEREISRYQSSPSNPADEETEDSNTQNTKKDVSDGLNDFYADPYIEVEDEDDLFRSGPNEEDRAVGEMTQLQKDASLRDIGWNFSPSPPAKISQNQNRPAVGAQQDLSLAPYLPRNNNSRISPQQKKITTAQSPELGPQEAKRQRYDFGNPELSNGGHLAAISHPVQTANSNQTLRSIERRSPLNTSTPRRRKEEIDDRNLRRKQTLTAQESVFTSPNTENKSPNLHLDVQKAQQGIPIPNTQAQTAPVVTPPRAQRVEYKRMDSEKARPTGSAAGSQVHKSSSTASTSQYEQQEIAFRELEDARSQHSDHSHHLNITLDDFDDKDEVAAEFEKFDEEHPPSSILQYLPLSPLDSVKVTFINREMDKQITMKFSSNSKKSGWEKVIEEEFSRQTQLYSNWDRVCLRHEDGSPVDLDGFLGDEDMTVYVVEATENDTWWMEKGMIMK